MRKEKHTHTTTNQSIITELLRRESNNNKNADLFIIQQSGKIKKLRNERKNIKDTQKSLVDQSKEKSCLKIMIYIFKKK